MATEKIVEKTKSVCSACLKEVEALIVEKDGQLK